MNKTFDIIFYRPVFGDGKAIDNAICTHNLAFNPFFWNKPKLWCSHVELRKDGMCSTSTMGQVGGKNRTGSGVCTRPESEILKHPERWWKIPLSTNYITTLDYQIEKSVKNNKGYDNSDIAKFFSWNRYQNYTDGKFICSGVVYFWLLFGTTVFTGTKYNWTKERLAKHQILCPSPIRLARWLIKLGHKPIDLQTEKEIIL